MKTHEAFLMSQVEWKERLETTFPSSPAPPFHFYNLLFGVGEIYSTLAIKLQVASIVIYVL